MKTLLVPIDFSSVTEDVATEAMRLAKALPARVVLFHAMPVPTPPYEYPPVAALVEEAAREKEKTAAAALANLTSRLRSAFIQTESVHAFGNAVTEIVERAEILEADYIVMGSHGHSAIYDLLLGSTTHGVLNRAKCPVIIIPAHKRTGPRKPADTSTQSQLATAAH